jgi:hypothetical protein
MKYYAALAAVVLGVAIFADLWTAVGCLAIVAVGRMLVKKILEIKKAEEEAQMEYRG